VAEGEAEMVTVWELGYVPEEIEKVGLALLVVVGIVRVMVEEVIPLVDLNLR
jgi:hypothetical protein